MAVIAYTYIELFSGGGFFGIGLGPNWRRLFANDYSAAKALSFRRNLGKGALKICDVADLATADLPGRADLLTMSTPCQDLSVGGTREGLVGKTLRRFLPGLEIGSRARC
jgi:DNA (cytosine-5)-methyltransferase 1